MNLEKATPELFAALAKAQANVENATKNSDNQHFRSKYADLAEVLNVVRPVFSAEGISIIQSTSFDGSTVTVVTALAHSAGGVITSDASCVPAKTDAQGVGSATTYLRRYALSAMAGVAQEDDDGNDAAHNGKPDQKKSQSKDAAKPASSAEQKRRLSEIDQDLVDCHSDADVKRCADVWQNISSRDGWSRDYKLAAKEKFDAKRSEIRAAEDAFPGDDGFPGSNDHQNELMAGEG